MPEIVAELGGTPVRTRVGHSFIKAQMAETGAIFGGEHSGHFYFRDFWRADSGMLAALHALAALAETDQPLSEVLAPYSRYVAERRDQLRGRRPGTPCWRSSSSTWADRDDVEIDHLDGLTVDSPTTGGSTSARPTPSRCCGSTSRAATVTPWRPVRDEVLAVIRRATMNLDSHLLDLVVCPNCRAVTRRRRRGRGAGVHRLPLPTRSRDDIPVLLVDEARKPETGAQPR